MTRVFFIVVIALTANGPALARPTAEELYEQGQVAYDRGDWPAAIARWRQSYDASGAAGLLFNLAQAYRLSGDCANALADYRRFVHFDQRSAQRRLAEDFIRALEPTCGAPPHPSPVARADELPRTSLEISGIITVGAGVVTLTSGLLLGVHASTLAHRVTIACASPNVCDWTNERDTDAAGHRDATVGYVLDVVGVAGIAAGAVAWYLGARQRAVSIAPRPGADGVAVTWSGTW